MPTRAEPPQPPPPQDPRRAERVLRGLACLVLAHDNAQQLALLLDWLGHHGARCFVHLDARAAAATRAELAASAPLPRATVLPLEQSRRVEWGGFAMVEATLALMRAALRDAPETRAVALLSGTHLPVQGAPAMASCLLDGREHIDLRFAATEPLDQKSLRRFWYRALPGREERQPLLRWVNRNSWVLGKRNLARGLRGMTPMVGSQWWCLTADCAQHVLGFVEAAPWYPRFFRFTSIPDETFFHTLVGASPFAERLAPAPLYQEVVGYSPRVLRAEDLPAAFASGLPFARKFDTRVDAAAVQAALRFVTEGGLPPVAPAGGAPPPPGDRLPARDQATSSKWDVSSGALSRGG